MCGRFVAKTPADQLAAYFGATALAEEVLEPSHNVAPTNQVHVVVEREDERRIDTFKWGLIPFWAKDTKIGNRMINARAETVATKNAFRKAFQRSRCIIPVDSFYEWVQVEGQEKKTPMRIYRTDGELFAFAGLWETWKDPEDGTVVRSCTILTGSPNERIGKIHDRMPVILPPAAWDEWLDRDQRDSDELQKFLVAAPPEIMSFHPVSTAVNSPRSKGAELMDAVEVPGAPSPELGSAA